MSAVVDASVLVAALVDSGRQGEWAENVVAGGSLHAPELVRVETTNILRRLERAGKVTTPEANAAYEDLVQLNIELFSFDPFADRIWELRHNVTSYERLVRCGCRGAQTAASDFGRTPLQGKRTDL